VHQQHHGTPGGAVDGESEGDRRLASVAGGLEESESAGLL